MTKYCVDTNTRRRKEEDVGAKLHIDIQYMHLPKKKKNLKHNSVQYILQIFYFCQGEEASETTSRDTKKPNKSLLSNNGNDIKPLLALY